ncbi:MAG: AEC family transporter [Candidatus Coproplasma sp.]
MGFEIAITNVLITLLFAAPGFALCKAKKASAEHLSTMSAVLIYVCSPCMIVDSFIQLDFNLTEFGKMGIFFGVTFVLQIAFMLVTYAIFRKKYDDAKYRVCTIGSVMGNVGFFGLPVVKALLPNNPEVACYSAVYVLSMNVLVFTVGVFFLTRDKRFMSLKQAVLNPSTLAFVVALPLYITGAKVYLPQVLQDATELLGKMTTPLCMFILGIRLGTISIKKLFVRPIVYLTCACKLIIFPLFCYACVAFVPWLDYAFKASVLILSAVPCASVILNLAEIHRAETELAANVLLLSTLVCFITIPVLVLLL